MDRLLAYDGARVAAQPASLPAGLVRHAATMPDVAAYHFRIHDDWTTLTWREAAREITQLAAGLAASVRPGDHVLVAAEPGWPAVQADLAVQSLGAVSVLVEPEDLSEPAVAAALPSLTAALVSPRAAAIREAAMLAPVAPTVVVLGDESGLLGSTGWADLLAAGDAALAADPGLVDRRRSGIGAGDPATVVLQRDAGRPAALRAPHAAWTHQGACVHALDLVDPADLLLSWQSLATPLGRALLAAQLVSGCALALEGDAAHVSRAFTELRPTVFAAPATYFDHVHLTLVDKRSGAAWSRDPRKVFEAAHQVEEADRRGDRVAGGLRRRAAELDAVRQLFGDRLRHALADGPVAHEVERDLRLIGVPLAGASTSPATSGFCTLRHPDEPGRRFCGRALPGEQLSDNEGEIWVRGTTVARRAGEPEHSWHRTGLAAGVVDLSAPVVDGPVPMPVRPAPAAPAPVAPAPAAVRAVGEEPAVAPAAPMPAFAPRVDTGERVEVDELPRRPLPRRVRGTDDTPLARDFRPWAEPSAETAPPPAAGPSGPAAAREPDAAPVGPAPVAPAPVVPDPVAVAGQGVHDEPTPESTPEPAPEPEAAEPVPAAPLPRRPEPEAESPREPQPQGARPRPAAAGSETGHTSSFLEALLARRAAAPSSDEPARARSDVGEAAGAPYLPAYPGSVAGAARAGVLAAVTLATGEEPPGRSAVEREVAEEQLLLAMEEKFVRLCQPASRFVVSARDGHGRVALVALDEEGLAKWGRQHSMTQDYATIAASADCHGFVSICLQAVNGGLPEEDRIHDFAILDHPLDPGADRDSLLAEHTRLLDQLALSGHH